MKKLLVIILGLGIPALCSAKVHVGQNDPITVSSVTITSTGIRFADGTVQVTSPTAGGGGGTPGGSTRQLQYNNGGSFAGTTSDVTSSSITFTGAAGAAVRYNLSVGSMTIPNLANTILAVNGSGLVISTTIPSAASSLTDFNVARVSTGVVANNTIATASAPVIGRVGSTTYSFTSSGTVTLSGTACSGTVYAYLSSAGIFTYGHNALTCTLTAGGTSAPTIATPISGFPIDSIPLWTLTITSGQWDTTLTDRRALYSVGKTFTAGSNVTLTETAGNLTIASSGGGGGSSLAISTGSAISSVVVSAASNIVFDSSTFRVTLLGTTTGYVKAIAYNPTDPTQFYRENLFSDFAFSNTQSWGYSGGCTAGGGAGATDIFQKGIVAPVYANVAAGNTGTLCGFSFPIGSNYQTGSYDYFSGSNPASLYVSSTYQKMDTNGASYVGLIANSGAEFIGCRSSGTANWFAVIRTAGADVATADTGFAHDTEVHRFQIDNGANGTPVANSIRCTVDGVSSATATGTVPAQAATAGGWSYGVGTIANNASQASFGAFAYKIWLRNLPIN